MIESERYGIEELAKATGRSKSTIKKWRKRIEDTAGYKFNHFVANSRYYGRNIIVNNYSFSKEELDKFVCLAKRVDKTKNLDSSIAEIWGVARKPLQEQLDGLREALILKLVLLKEEQERLSRNMGYLERRVAELTEELERMNEKTFKDLIFRNKK